MTVTGSTEGKALDPWFLENLACPEHRGRLRAQADALLCAAGCRFPVVCGIPFMLPQALDPTHRSALTESLELARHPDECGRILDEPLPPDGVDAYVNQGVAGTNSLLYLPAVGRLTAYPIPELPMRPASAGELLLDIGCNWGRWSLAAARAGYAAVGIDPSLRALLAATRVARQLGLPVRYVAADGRFLPFRDGLFDAAFSYGVLQHLSKDNVLRTLESLRPCLRDGAVAHLHLLNAFGLRSLQVQLRRGFREAVDFETRYWTPGELLRAFEARLGPSRIEIDGFFTEGRPSDLHLFLPQHRALVRLSEALKRCARLVPALKYLADNLFVVSGIK